MLGSLKQTVENDHIAILDFFNRQDEMYIVLDGMIIVTRSLLIETLENITQDECSFTRYMLWRTMYDYTETSLLLLLKTRVDEGYALLRMASELARDIVRIGESKNNFLLWQNRAACHKDEKYKSAFRFNKSNPLEQHIYNLYNLASMYGVHSHQTRDTYLNHLGVVINDRFIKVCVSERNMLDALNVWLFSFFPLHKLVAQTFLDLYEKLDPNPYKRFCETEMSFMPALKNIKENVKKM